MTEENATKARSIFDKMIKNKPLLDIECLFLEEFVEENLQKCRLNRNELEKSRENKIKEKANVAIGSDNTSSGFDEKNLVCEDLQNLSISPEQNRNGTVKKEKEGRNNANSPCPSLNVDETESTSSKKTEYPNHSLIEYSAFVSEEKKFLKLSREPLPFAAELKNEKISYPIGVQFDEVRSEWFICDKKASKVIVINTSNEGKIEVIEHPTLPQPSAVCILKEGESVAVLCENKGFSIVEFLTMDSRVIVYCDHINSIYDIRGNLRGLAKTAGGNLMALDHSSKRHKSLQVFKKDVGYARFPIEKAQNPCFIASNGTSVAISDLGTQSVFLYKLDDTNWNDISFQQLRQITSEPMEISRLCDQSGFAFVGGLQFDASGNLLIGDAQGHTIKLYNQELDFLHRLSTDFPMPYMSTFWVNKQGKIMILDIRSPTDKLIYAQIGNTEEVEQWNPRQNTRSNSGQNRPFRRQKY